MLRLVAAAAAATAAAAYAVAAASSAVAGAIAAVAVVIAAGVNATSCCVHPCIKASVYDLAT